MILTNKITRRSFVFPQLCVTLAIRMNPAFKPTAQRMICYSHQIGMSSSNARDKSIGFTDLLPRGQSNKCHFLHNIYIECEFGFAAMRFTLAPKLNPESRLTAQTMVCYSHQICMSAMNAGALRKHDVNQTIK